MVNKSDTTEEAILKAAETVFTRKGMSGARMQEIADEAGINKALLHYYFRNKELLFEAVFQRTFNRFLPALFAILDKDEPLEDKLAQVVDHYYTEFSDRTYIPVFLINEINQNPDRLRVMAERVSHLKTSRFIQQLEKGAKEGKYSPVSPAQLISNLLSLIIFPLIAAPLFKKVFGLDDDSFRNMLRQKSELIPAMIIDSIRPK